MEFGSKVTVGSARFTSSQSVSGFSNGLVIEFNRGPFIEYLLLAINEIEGVCI